MAEIGFVHKAFVYRSPEHGVYRVDCGRFSKLSWGVRRRSSVHNLTEKLKRKVEEAIRGEPITFPYRFDQACKGDDLDLGGRAKCIRVEYFEDSLHRVHRIDFYYLTKDDLR